MSGEMTISGILELGEMTTATAAGTIDELVDLCERYFKSLGTVPKISFEGDHLAIEVVQMKNRDTRRYGTFSQSFDVINGFPLKEFKPTIYIHRAKGTHLNQHGKTVWHETSMYHLQDLEDPTMAKCGAAQATVYGYRLVLKPKPMLRSRTCANCVKGVVVRQKPPNPTKLEG